MICYTRNFEDVILQRVFADVAAGHHVDVGASTPVEDSNTYALYQKGWRGVAIEPLPHPYPKLWKQSRPEDIFLNVVAGASAGEWTLQIFDQSGQISSGSAETVAHWQRHGEQPTRSVVVPMLTLDSVIGEHLAGKPLHLVSIDVEGMEHAVLSGLDLNKHRPWVLVVEATVPGTPVPSHQAWEAGLLASDYALVYWDGVNRFYLAHEQLGLLDRFALPPNVWDEFVMATQVELEAEVARLTAQLADLQARLPK